MRFAFRVLFWFSLIIVAWVTIFALGVLFVPAKVSELAFFIRQQVQDTKGTELDAEREAKIRELIEAVLRPTPPAVDDFTDRL